MVLRRIIPVLSFVQHGLASKCSHWSRFLTLCRFMHGLLESSSVLSQVRVIKRQRDRYLEQFATETSITISLALFHNIG